MRRPYPLLLLPFLLSISTVSCGGPRAVVITPEPPAGGGSLFIVGGGARPDSLMRYFIDLAGGRDSARIVVIPLASASQEETGEAQAAGMRRLGADARVVRITRESALLPETAATIENATGIWFSGGVQSRITEVLAGTPMERALHARYRAGAVIGGTSAGAAIMSTPMITGNERWPEGARDTTRAFARITRDAIVTTAGLGFLPGAIVDQHFVRRRRHNRLLSLVLEQPSLVGVGIDEGTALIAHRDGSWSVVGESVVVVYDARRGAVTGANEAVLGATDVRMHVLPAGATFDPASGDARLRGAAARR